MKSSSSKFIIKFNKKVPVEPEQTYFKCCVSCLCNGFYAFIMLGHHIIKQKSILCIEGGSPLGKSLHTPKCASEKVKCGQLTSVVSIWN